jgi:hypothetical protein
VGRVGNTISFAGVAITREDTGGAGFFAVTLCLDENTGFAATAGLGGTKVFGGT